MQRAATAEELRAALDPVRAAGTRIALVPTMGNLHEGHLALVARARQQAECVVASVFVNPLQFGAGEDFDRYPRTLEADAAKLQAVGVDVLFAPAVETMYPNGYPPATRVQVEATLTAVLEGARRPGHFDGVATVVAALFNRVRPDLAVFGEKDWQQLAMIRRMVADLGMDIEIVGEPIMRASDGLALSSRNQYLTPAERRLAPRLHAALEAVAGGLRSGRRDFERLCAAEQDALAGTGFRPEYLEIRRTDLESARAEDLDLVILAAVWLGRTRLIDNLRVRLDIAPHTSALASGLAAGGADR